jgi:hypothetical protein
MKPRPTKDVANMGPSQKAQMKVPVTCSRAGALPGLRVGRADGEVLRELGADAVGRAECGGRDDDAADDEGVLGDVARDKGDEEPLGPRRRRAPEPLL